MGRCGGEMTDETNLCPRFDAVEAVDVGARIDDPAHGGLIETDATRYVVVVVFPALRPCGKRAARTHTVREEREGVRSRTGNKPQHSTHSR